MGYKLVTKMVFHSEKPLGEQTNCKKIYSQRKYNFLAIHSLYLSFWVTTSFL